MSQTLKVEPPAVRATCDGCDFWHEAMAGVCGIMPGEAVARKGKLPICAQETKRRIVIDGLRAGTDDNITTVCANWNIPISQYESIVALRASAAALREATSPVTPIRPEQ